MISYALYRYFINRYIREMGVEMRDFISVRGDLAGFS